MSITKENKQNIIQSFAQCQADTGSPEVQCAILTAHIKNITKHLQVNKKDFQCRRGLLVMVHKRKKLLNYLKRSSEHRYMELITRLELRK